MWGGLSFVTRYAMRYSIVYAMKYAMRYDKNKAFSLKWEKLLLKSKYFSFFENIPKA